LIAILYFGKEFHALTIRILLKFVAIVKWVGVQSYKPIPFGLPPPVYHRVVYYRYLFCVA